MLLHVLLFSLIEIVLVLLAVVIGVAMIVTFGAPWDGHHSRCPACGAESLSVLDTGHQPGRLTIYRCGACGTGFRQQLDGTLAAMPTN